MLANVTGSSQAPGSRPPEQDCGKKRNRHAWENGCMPSKNHAVFCINEARAAPVLRSLEEASSEFTSSLPGSMQFHGCVWCPSATLGLFQWPRKSLHPPSKSHISCAAKHNGHCLCQPERTVCNMMVYLFHVTQDTGNTFRFDSQTN